MGKIKTHRKIRKPSRIVSSRHIAIGKINVQVAELSYTLFLAALPINNFLLMQELEPQDYAGCIKPRREK